MAKGLALCECNLKCSLTKIETTLHFPEHWLFTKHLTSTWKCKRVWIQASLKQLSSRIVQKKKTNRFYSQGISKSLKQIIKDRSTMDLRHHKQMWGSLKRAQWHASCWWSGLGLPSPGMRHRLRELHLPGGIIWACVLWFWGFIFKTTGCCGYAHVNSQRNRLDAIRRESQSEDRPWLLPSECPRKYHVILRRRHRSFQSSLLPHLVALPGDNPSAPLRLPNLV